MANWEAYRALKTESERVGWPKHWKTDLTKHDRIHLSKKDAPEEFIWVLRECGTFLFELGKGHKLDWLIANYNLYGPRPNRSGKTAHWYIWRDGELAEIEADEALEEFIESIEGQPVYRENRRTGRKIEIGTLREVAPNVPTTYGHKNRVYVDRHVDRKRRSYLTSEVTIG